ncbi:MAG: hypothetical protein ACI8QS_000314 [Planctomycetota bacterium]|jgi:hypothetical protein
MRRFVTPRNLRALVPASLLVLGGIGVALGGDERPDLFRQLRQELPTPNTYRTASGAPGHEYWQQQVDYIIDVELDDEAKRLTGSEEIRYQNNSPDTLKYLWVQVDANIYGPDSHAVLSGLAPSMDSMSFDRMRSTLARQRWDGAAEISRVVDQTGAELKHTIVDTMMRIDLPRPLKSGQDFSFGIDWTYEINDSKLVSGRTGYEYFEEDDNRLYEIAQWFPRLCAYTDYEGWQNKEFLGRGEFTLEFGDYLVRITAPEDHVIASTGMLQNPAEVLTADQQARLTKAETSDNPVFIITPEEAENNEASRARGKKTWVYKADNVRDFAWASSRKFIWDAMLMTVPISGDKTWAMSYYPNEAEPMWSKFSTHAVAQTVDVYSEHAFPYPYPVAISVNGPVGGMEYPMLCFNGPRPEKDGTYSLRTKSGLIGVIIHEVGHNWFPMIVNSDERQWTWMDEGLNTFVQYLAEQRWQDEYPSRRGEPRDIVSYMTSENSVPIMTNSESILQFGPNAYSKPATALNVLRETVLGRDLFDFAFREYSQRWMFKRPEPADLFRTMEDATSVDLDWFWRGWFYTTDYVDLSLTGLSRYRIDTRNPEVEKAIAQRERGELPQTLAAARNASMPKRVHAYPELADFYNTYDALEITGKDIEDYEKLLAGMESRDEELLRTELNFYVVEITNETGLPMPAILEFHYTDGTTEELRLPAQIWQKGNESISKLHMSIKEVESVVLDPHHETADANLADNHWPQRMEEGRIRLTTGGRWDRGGSNPMRAASEWEASQAEAATEDAKPKADGED